MDTDADDVELALDPKPELDPEPESSILDAGGDPAAEAFARLEGELALMRRAVQHLAVERADIVIPDYGATLTDMAIRRNAVHRLGRMVQVVPRLPDPVMVAAASCFRCGSDSIGNAVRGHLHRRMTSHVFQALANRAYPLACTAAEQRQQLFKVAGGALLAGILLWSFLPGTVARTMPQRWHLPERMAARMVGASSVWNAGARLMQSDSPQAWIALAQAADIQRDNRDAIAACRKSASTSKQPVRCVVKIRAKL